MIAAIKEHGAFRAPTAFTELEKLVEGYIGTGAKMGEGWLLTSEMLELIHSGVNNIVCTQPFGCLPNHVCGRGQYAALVRRVGAGKLVSVDVDASLPRLGVYHRVKLLLEPWEECSCAIK